jgi:hypothetical protein
VLVAGTSLLARILSEVGVDRGGNDVQRTARLLGPAQVTAADVREIVRAVLHQCRVPFTDIAVTSSASAWTVVIHDQNGLIFRLPVQAGPLRVVRQAIVEAIEAEW